MPALSRATAYNCNDERPPAANLNFPAGLDTSKHVEVEPSAEGEVCVYVSATTHLVVDIQDMYL